MARTNTAGDLRVNLATDDESEVSVPLFVMIPNGESTTVFDITVLDDMEIDGLQRVTISAGATGHLSDTTILEVIDNEISFSAILDDGDTGFTQTGFTSLSNSQVATAYEGDNHNMRGGSGSANWTFTGLQDGQYQVAATWSHKYNNAYNAKDAPYTILDSEGVQLASAIVDQSINPEDFSADGVKWNTLATVNVTGGTLTVNLGAGSNSNRYTVADAVRIELTDNPSPALTFEVNQTSIIENGEAIAVTILRDGIVGDLTITLSSSDSSELELPATVTIRDGEDRTTFDIVPNDDLLVDGSQTVTVTASAHGQLQATVEITVNDNETPFSAILDDGDTGFTQTGFTSLSNSQVATAYEGDNHNMRGGSGSANWTFTGLQDGQYQVAATWSHKYNNAYNAKDAPYTILDSEGVQLASAIVDQSINPEDFSADGVKWNTLATVNVTGGTLTVNLGAGSNSNRYTVADAVRIVYLGSESNDNDPQAADAVFGTSLY